MKSRLWQVNGLQKLLEEDLRIELISEKLYVVDDDAQAKPTAEKLRARGYEECGVRRGKSVHEIVSRDALAQGTKVGLHAKPAPLSRIVAPSTPIWACMDRLSEHQTLFVLGHNEIERIVTLSDLSKQPARLLMFGVISTIEMVLLEIVRSSYPGDSWKSKLSAGRIRNATRLHAERLKKKQEIDLADCLQLCDKSTICLKTEGVLEIWKMSKTGAKKLLDSITVIRDNLAHAQSPDVAGDWRNIIGSLKDGHALLDRTVKGRKTWQRKVDRNLHELKSQPTAPAEDA